MIQRIIEAHHVRGFVIHLRFSDGTEGDVDLADDLSGEIFEPLNELSYFKQFVLHPELHTICWPNGADFAPEYLHDRIQVPA
jgi:hypothetical protein